MTIRHQYRSGYEAMIGQDLDNRGIRYEFEAITLTYTSAVRGGTCLSCGSKKIGKARKYTPDFTIDTGSGMLVVEAKGRFPSTDRSKMRDVQKANPEVTLKLLFQKRSRTQMDVVSAWCRKNNFRFAFGTEVPQEWIDGEDIDEVPTEYVP